MTTLTRRKARELAFQFIFANAPGPDAAQTLSHPPDYSQSEFEVFARNFGEQADDFSWVLANGTGKNLPQIDQAIQSSSTNWRIERMSRIDLTVLRIGTYELLFEKQTPRSVVINEAVELAKSFGAEDSAAFVNGILDKVAESVAK